MSRTIRFACLTLVSLAPWALGCVAPAGDSQSGGSNDGSSEDVTEVQIALSSVPAGVLCIKIAATVAGQAVTIAPLTVAAGASSATLSLGQLPLGAATFSGSAFSVACASVTSTTVPAWISDPASATLGAGIVSTVALTFRKDNPVTVNANFLDNLSRLVTGNNSTYALMTDGTVKAIGQSTSVAGLSGIVELAPTREGACGRRADGTVWCVGTSLNGELGPAVPVGNTTTTAVQVPLPGAAEDLSASFTHVCATVANNSFCWGHNDHGQLGNGTKVDSSTPVNGGGAARIFAGISHTCGISSGGVVQCWGQGDTMQLGSGVAQDSTVPVTVPGLGGIVQMALGSNHTCALSADGTVRCWGLATNGQVGSGSFSPDVAATPTLVVGISTAVEIVAGTTHTCARLQTGTISCWGAGRALGNGTDLDSASPIPVAGITNAVAVRSNEGAHTCAELADHTAKCWGDNTFGQIGDGTTFFAPVPTFLHFP